MAERLQTNAGSDQRPGDEASAPMSVVSGAEAIGSSTKAVIERVAASVSERLAALRKAADALEKLVLEDSARLKTEIDAHIHLAETAAGESDRLMDVIADLRSRRARLVNARVSEGA